MLCEKPVIVAGRAFGCRQCMPCRFNRRREWTHRIMLEAKSHEFNAFVTLTYREVPPGGSLQPDDLQLWLKRLRRAVEPARFRFFAVGEYGDENWRPHYHAMLFGYPPCRYGRTRATRDGKCCDRCELVARTWRVGFVYVGEVSERSAAYVAGYVVKGMTRKDDPRLQGRVPEFTRMSLRRGIGFDALHEVASTVMKYKLDDREGDVPSSLTHGGKTYPLGRYLRRNLRELVGREKESPHAAMAEADKKMLPLRMAAARSEERPGLRAHVVKANAGRRARLIARSRLFGKKRGVL